MLLAGGQGNVFQCDQVVLKQSTNEIEVDWSCQILSSIDVNGFRLASPIPAKSGRFWFQGWSAQTFIPGKTIRGEKFTERFEASKCFHVSLRSIDCPSFLSERADPWAIADRITWHALDWDTHSAVAPVLNSLRSLEQPIGMEHQVIHGDISGNFLYETDLPLGIIDFTPYWSPVGFGEAILVVDVILWEGALLEEMLSISNCDKDSFQLIVRAAIRRLLEIDCQHRDGMRKVMPLEEVERYRNLTEQLEVVSKHFS